MGIRNRNKHVHVYQNIYFKDQRKYSSACFVLCFMIQRMKNVKYNKISGRAKCYVASYFLVYLKLENGFWRT